MTKYRLSQWTSTMLASVFVACLTASPLAAQNAMPSGFAGTWTLSDATSGDVGLDAIILLAAGKGLRVERKGSSQRPTVEYEPVSSGAFFLAENSSTNPLGGKPAEWIRIDQAGIHIHHMKTTPSGGIEIITEELFPTPDDPEMMNYRRLDFIDGVQTSEATGTLTRGP